MRILLKVELASLYRSLLHTLPRLPSWGPLSRQRSEACEGLRRTQENVKVNYLPLVQSAAKLEKARQSRYLTDVVW